MIADPISDFIIRLQNASRARKEQVSLPASKLKVAVARVLEREGYLAGADTQKSSLSMTLAYRAGKPALNGVKRISKPSRRVYLGTRELKSVKRGHGLLILSTPAGILTGKEAKEKRLGGEALFEIW